MKTEMHSADGVRQLARETIKAEGMSAAAWAMKNGLSQSYLSRILSGQMEPSAKLLTVLGITRVTAYSRKVA